MSKYICAEVLKNRSVKIWASLMLLLIFVAGQVVVFAHSHKFDVKTTKHYSQKERSKISEDNCPICAQHGNFQILLQQNNNFYFWSLTSSYDPIACTPIYQSVELLLSGNRGPPTV